MGMKKKMLSATLCAVMVGSLVAPAFTVQAADDTLVYWSMWEATEPQGQVIQEAVDAYTEQTGVKVDLQFKDVPETVKHFSLHWTAAHRLIFLTKISTV